MSLNTDLFPQQVYSFQPSYPKITEIPSNATILWQYIFMPWVLLVQAPHSAAQNALYDMGDHFDCIAVGKAVIQLSFNNESSHVHYSKTALRVKELYLSLLLSYCQWGTFTFQIIVLYPVWCYFRF